MDKARRNKELNCLDFFKKDGLLAERVANYEQRPQQYEMAEAVLRALNENRTAIIEAGTGTGKSLAYLIPAITYATEGIRRVVISTYSKTLQHQLMEKDLPSAKWRDVGWPEIDLYLKERAPEFNSCSPDLDAFTARGGKIIMSTGWEDQTVPPAPIIDYYERVCARDGGIEKTKEYFRLFCTPGCAHGGGKGRAMTGTPSGSQARKLLMAWHEKGIAPDTLQSGWKSKNLDMPIAAYPGLYVKDASGKWQVKQTKRGVPRIDGVCLETKKGM